MDNNENISISETQAAPDTIDTENVDSGQPGFTTMNNAIPEQPRNDAVDDDELLPLKKRSGKWKVLVTIIVLLLAAGAAFYFLRGRMSPAAQTTNEYVYYTVGRRDITSTLSGSGTLNPADSYNVTALVSGEILWADFEEGDIVDKNAPLYQIDSSDAQTSIEQAENSLIQSQTSYNQKERTLDDLRITASATGSVISMLVKPGDKVSAGQMIASIRDSRTMVLTIPFGTDDANLLAAGQTAVIVLDGTFEQLDGVISKISTLEEMLSGSMIVRMVSIDVANPGGLSMSHIATASVGNIYSNGSGTFGYKAEENVSATTSGEVVAVNAKEGDWVQKDSLLVQLKSDSLTNDLANSANSLRNEELSLENKYKQLDNYAIKSPISGTIIEKYYKEGDNLDAGRTLCMIYDLSYLTMTLNVDELDIASVLVGQAVTVTAEALGDRVFQGAVTRININGNTVNGVTSYPVTIRIDETEGLLPGMNVQAEIVTSYSQNTIAIPVSALSRGNRVLVRTEGRDTTQSNGDTQQFGGGERPVPDGENRPQFGGEGAPQFNGSEGAPRFDDEGAPQFDGENRPQFSGGERPVPDGGNQPQFNSSEGAPQSDGESVPQFGEEGSPTDGGSSRLTSGERQQSSQSGFVGAGQDGLPEGYEYVIVTVGVSDDSFIEITSGLYEGDEIAYIPDTGAVTNNMFPDGMYGGMGVTVVGGGPVQGGGPAARPGG